MVKGSIVHERYMRVALNLAKKAKGKTSPNPLVGALVVKNGKILAQGYHRTVGLPHAEVMALEKAGKSAQGATLYVTLEPCCHFGRTAPCVNRISDSGIKEVVFSMYDPNPLNNGRGARFLRRQGIKTVGGVLEEETRKINEVFIKYITQKTPFVTVKVAQSLDGKIATFTGDSRWVSSEKARIFVHRLRAQADAVLVGIDTILKDNPLLSCRINGSLYRRQPKKVVLDSKLRLSPGLNIFSSRSPAEVIIATTKSAPRKKLLFFKRKNIQIIVAKDIKKRVDLRDLFKKLAGQEISHILIEGGGETIASALKMKLVDRFIVIISAKIIGGRQAPTSVEGEGVSKITQAVNLKDIKIKRLGPDIVVEGRPA